MVSAQEGIGPGARALERVVGHHGLAVQHRALFAVRLEPRVRVCPDARVPGDLALAVGGAATRAVALVLLAVALGAQVRDVGQRAVTAVAAVKHRDLDRVLQHVERLLDVGLLNGGVELGPDLEARRPGLKHPAVQGAVELVERGDLAARAVAGGVGEAGGICGRQLVGGKPRAVALKRLEGTGLAKAHVRNKRAPVIGRMRIGHLQHAGNFQGITVARDVDALVAEAARDHQLLGGKLKEERAALVGRLGLLFGNCEQRVGDHAARDLAGVERAGHRGGEDVRVADDGDGEPLAAHPAQELVLAVRVVAHLGDRVIRTGPRLEFKLQELRDQVALKPLERVDGATEVEALHGLGGAIAGRLGDRLAAHLAQQRKQRHGVNVKDRARAAAMTGRGIVASEREDRGEPA